MDNLLLRFLSAARAFSLTPDERTTVRRTLLKHIRSTRKTLSGTQTIRTRGVRRPKKGPLRSPSQAMQPKQEHR